MSAVASFGAQTAQSLVSSASSPKPFKSQMLKHIDGELPGSPPMTGVTTHHYSRNQQLYLDDFKQVTANRVMHPYVTTTVCGNQIDSSPHNLITGTAYAPVGSAAGGTWMSESARQFPPKNWLSALGQNTGGLRTEQLIFDAKYVS